MMELPPLPAEKCSTRPKQFETMVTFMEEHGDISNARAQTPRIRLALLHGWERLSVALNAQADGGHSRTLDKWKKVWSDLKNNTKKKAHRLARARAAGGGVGTKARLSKLELRVLKIMGMVKQSVAASSLLPEPPPLTAAPAPAPPATLALVRLTPSPPPPEDLFQITFDAWGRRAPQDPLISPKLEVESQNSDDLTLEDSFLYSTPRLPSPQTEECTMPGDRVAEDPVEERGTSPKPDDRGHTNTRGVVVRRRSALSRVLLALSREHARRERTRLAVRARELRLQRGWQRICERGLTLMERYLDSKMPAKAPPVSREAPKQTLENSEEVPENPEAAVGKWEVLEEEEASVEILDELDEAPEETEPHIPLVLHPERVL